MNQNQDFSALQNLLALKRDEIPVDTQVNHFLIEFHRRQRARLLQQPVSPWTYSLNWISQKIEGLTDKLALGQVMSTLSYSSAFAAVVLFTVLMLPQEGTTPVSRANTSSNFSINLPSAAVATQPTASMSLLPASASNLLHTSAQKLASNFKLTRFTTTVPQFVLVDSHAAYDAHAAF